MGMRRILADAAVIFLTAEETMEDHNWRAGGFALVIMESVGKIEGFAACTCVEGTRPCWLRARAWACYPDGMLWMDQSRVHGTQTTVYRAHPGVSRCEKFSEARGTASEAGRRHVTCGATSNSTSRMPSQDISFTLDVLLPAGFTYVILKPNARVPMFTSKSRCRLASVSPNRKQH